jgi:hypothetical protein
LARTPSHSAARCQRFGRLGALGSGVVSAMKRSIAATTAAASAGLGAGVTSSIRGRGGRRVPFVGTKGI